MPLEIMQMTKLMNILIFVLIGGSLYQLHGQDISTNPPEHQVYINDVLIEGNKITKRNIFLRELVFSIGDSLEEKQLKPAFEKSRENLLNLSIFNFVTIESQHVSEKEVNVIIKVTERWYIWPTPIFEHGDRNLSAFLKEPQWNKLNYGVWLKWNNFRGRNELLNARVRLGYKEQYVLQYEKPNIGPGENHKIFVSYSLLRQHRVNYISLENMPVYFTDEDKYAYNSTDAFVAYAYRPELYSRHRIRLHYVNDWISDTVASLNPELFGNDFTRHKLFKIDYVYNYDNRDSKVYPLEGQAYKIKLQRLGLGIIQDYPYGSWEAEAALFYHRKIADRFYFTEVSKGKLASNKDVPLSQKQALGYTENLTAYDSYVIDGTDYIVNKIIFRYQLLKPHEFTFPLLKAKQFSKAYFGIYLNYLADIGYVNNKVNIPSNTMVNKLQYSTGIGIDFVTYYDKVFGIEYAINRYGTTGFFFHIATPFYEW